jgi:hypothetical protein
MLENISGGRCQLAEVFVRHAKQQREHYNDHTEQVSRPDLNLRLQHAARPFLVRST